MKEMKAKVGNEVEKNSDYWKLKLDCKEIICKWLYDTCGVKGIKKKRIIDLLWRKKTK